MMRLPPGEPSTACSRPFGVEHQRRRHRGQRPLARFRAIGHRLAIAFGCEGKIGELVVEQKTVDLDAAAETGLDRTGQGDSIALAIDDRQVGGGRQFRRITVGLRCPREGTLPGRGNAHGSARKSIRRLRRSR
jgi:hypothetical protein